MQELFKNKTLLTGVAIIILVLLGFNIFMGSSDMPADEGSLAGEAPGADLLKLSGELSKVTLGQELFSSATYRGLVDFAVPKTDLPLGRTNPFDLIGRD